MSSKKDDIASETIAIVPIVIEHHPDCPYAKKPRGTGPAQVASEEYRTGWEAIFGAKPVVGQA